MKVKGKILYETFEIVLKSFTLNNSGKSWSNLSFEDSFGNLRKSKIVPGFDNLLELLSKTK